ncbi:MAG: hypothetical protein H0U49_06790 [Parachlamydiaceae bacterium]|nr:hypothetical protein [Parachlamydiaceae bacterium]
MRIRTLFLPMFPFLALMAITAHAQADDDNQKWQRSEQRSNTQQRDQIQPQRGQDQFQRQGSSQQSERYQGQSVQQMDPNQRQSQNQREFPTQSRRDSDSQNQPSNWQKGQMNQDRQLQQEQSKDTKQKWQSGSEWNSDDKDVKDQNDRRYKDTQNLNQNWDKSSQKVDQNPDLNKDWDKNTQKRDQNPDLNRDSKGDSQYTKDNYKKRESDWKNRGSSVRKSYTERREHHHIFDDHYWSSFRSRHHNWYFDRHFHWHSSPSWQNVVVWFPRQWDRPIMYYYGSNGTIYYSNNIDTYNYIPVSPGQFTARSAYNLATSAPSVSARQADWMPLGTFAITYDSDSQDEPQEYISLAISKNGAITGAYAKVGENIPLQIEGAIDDKTQRVAWKFIGQDWPVMETGLYNLTKDESTLLIHSSPDRSEARLLVRLEK